MNRTDRLVAMVLFLQGRRVVRAEDLAAHFEVNIRTVYRDLAALGEAGVPISGEAGVGYSLLRGYHLPPVMLTPEEAVALFVGGGMVKHYGDASTAGAISTALLKLRAILPRENQEEVDRLAETTSMERRSGDPQEVDQATLLPIYRAIAKRRVLQLFYQGLADSRPQARQVEPLGVVFHTGAWYLIAWCRLRSDFRQFKLNRLHGLEVQGETFPPRADFDLSRFLRDQMQALERLDVRLWVSTRARDRLRRQSYEGFVSEVSKDDGWVVDLKTYSYAWLASWLLSFGTEVRVLAPEALQRELQQQLEALTRHHQSSGKGS